jgi:anti-sigma regulatory factor (Ser/Thr protein kinase)
VEFDVEESVSLAPTTSSAAMARRFLADRISGPSAEDAILAMSELVSNALLNTSGRVRVTVKRGPSDVTIEVWDNDPIAVPVWREPPQTQPGGRGLHIIEAISDSWGHRPDPPGKVVWATVSLREG